MLIRTVTFLTFILLSAFTSAATQTIIKDWAVECDNQGACVIGTQGNGVVILVGRDSQDNGLRVVMQISPESQTDTPATVRLDNGWQAPLKVSVCHEQFCEIIIRPDMVGEFIKAIKPVRSGHIAYMLGTDKIVIAKFSLLGISKALSHL